jgi:hypothetical protein
MKNAPSVLAIAISLVALCFSALQWHEAHSELLLSMKPSVNFTNEDDIDEGAVGISIDNAGPGPAKIKSVTYFIDKKPVGDVEKATDFTNVDDVHFLELDEGDTLGVGAKDWLLKYSKKPHGKKDQQQLDDFLDVLDHHLAVQVEFCPVLNGECGKKCSTKGWCE